MPHSEVGSDVETKLNLITLRAKDDSSYRFTCLAHLLNEEFLERCYRSLGKNKATGVDGISWKEYGENLHEKIRDVVNRMKAKQYRPQPARRVYIPKDEHTKRPLGIPVQEDKMVGKAVSRVLESIYEADFYECSHGFRKGRGCQTALKAVNEILLKQPVNHIIEADIKGFFDALSHKWMMELLSRRINDPSLLRIIARFLIAGYMDSELLVESTSGVPQGGTLSPILANVFLHYVLDEWFTEEIKPHISGQCHLVRYADDFIILVQFKEEAYRVMELLRKRFSQFDLELHPDKTRIVSFGKYEVVNAGKQNRKASTFDFLGLTHYCTKSRHGGFLVGRVTIAKRFRKKLKELTEWFKNNKNVLTLKELWKSLKRKLQGHYAYYGISGNYRGIKRFYQSAVKIAFKWLNRRSQKKSFNWEEFTKYLKAFPLPRPRIVHQLYKLSTVK